MKRRKTFASITALCCFVVFFTPLFTACFNTVKKTFSEELKTYYAKELDLIEADSFGALNKVVYPDGTDGALPVSKSFVSSVCEFANRTYSAFPKYSENFCFSPITLYDNFTVLELSTVNPAASGVLNALLGLDRETREQEYLNAYKNNFFSNASGTLQRFKGMFLTNEFKANDEYIAALTKYYCEAFKLDFLKADDVKKMLGWVDERVQDKGFFKAKDFNITEDTVFMLFATMYFNNRWATAFNTNKTYTDTFYLSDKTTATASYMQHSYATTDVYDYGDYVSVYDYYRNGMKIKYLVAKDEAQDDVFKLTEGVNVFKDDATRKKTTLDNGAYDRYIVNLSVPKFKADGLMNLKDLCDNLGLSVLFDKTVNSFGYIFDDAKLNANVYLSFVLQKNKITLNEDGTVIKSVSVAGGDKAMSVEPSVEKTINVVLNKPFIYVVYDRNDLPVFIGRIDNPKY